MSESTETDFYEALVDDYDKMTGFEGRLAAAGQFVEKLSGKTALYRAVDVACGSGLYAIALAKAGIEVLGLDISPGMLKAADENARLRGVRDKLRWKIAAMQALDSAAIPESDAVLCMANSIPHILTDDELEDTMQNFFNLLQPGGIAVIQLLNYHRILQQKERIIAIDRDGEREFIRFYDFLEDGLLRFNVLSLGWGGSEKSGEAEHELHSVRLRPYTYSQIGAALKEQGFEKVAFYGSTEFTAFDPNASLTVMVTARRPSGLL
ncbi:MAG: methyltransferase domain-containing protein [Lentisphaeria bacterium]